VREMLVPLGTPCVDSDQCRAHFERHDVLCEHVGLIGTTSIGGRIRYRGIMQDPNELAFVTSIAVALAFAFFELRRTLPRLLLAGTTLVVVGVCVVLTKSRSGQIAFMAVLGVYLLRRLRWAGVGLAVVMALPILLFGGRSTAEADESSSLRLGYWAAAIQMARDSPLVGIGMGQFAETQPETAHNSLMLALGETGVPGLFFWTALMYTAFKTTLSVLRKQTGADAHVARVWGCALLAALAGYTGSAMFLSLTDHYVVWVYLGLAGALYAATVTHDPSFRVRFGLRDLAGVIAFDALFVLAAHVYTRSKGF
jgi:O-antigen ligase